MPLSIKVNLRVTGHCNQGGRKYMEDMFSVAYQQTSDDKDLEYAFFGIFDGHGGGEAATFAKEHLMDIIVKQRNFWSDKDEDVLRAIRDGYVNTHYAMWRELEKWPRTSSGLPSTAGTTASVAFIRKGKIYIGHVGDSAIILGYQEEGDTQWKAKALTEDHKPESVPEMIRIKESGGKVVCKSGVPRVVWNRPRIGHKGPVRRSTHIDEIPFLAVARSLGDLWSYNSELDTFVVSPEPDVKVVTVDVKSHRCLIFGTDGLWNMLTPDAAVGIVQAAERHNEKHLIASQQTGNGQTDIQMWINPSKSLVDRALERWTANRMRADNTSVVTLMLDPPGPSRSDVLMSRKNERMSSPKCIVPSAPVSPRAAAPLAPPSNPILKPASPLASALPSVEKVASPQNPGATTDSHQTPPVVPTSKNEPAIPEEATETPEEAPKTDCATLTNLEAPSLPSEVTPTETSAEEPKEPTTEPSEVNNEPIPETETLEIPDKPDKPPEEAEEPEQPTCPDFSREAIPDIISVIDSLSPPPVCNSVPTEATATNLVRQNAFCSGYEVFNSRPRLRRGSNTAFGSVPTLLANQTTNQITPEVPCLLPRRRGSQGSALVSHLESRTTVRRRQSVNTTSTCLGERPKSYFGVVGSRVKREISYLGVSREHRQTIETLNSRTTTESSSIVVKTTTNTSSTTINNNNTRPTVGSKRRHSSTSEPAEDATSCANQEPIAKRRTRSEDRPAPIDENDPANQEKQQQQQQQQQQHSRLRWPEDTTNSNNSSSRQRTDSSSRNPSVVPNGQEKLPSPNGFQRRSLEKKATPVKTIRRPSINGSSRIQLRGSFALREWDQSKGPHRDRGARLNRSVGGVIGSSTSAGDASSPNLQRWLRSDTLAATPVKTLRSRNVDITGHTVPAQLAHQYGVVKQNRLSLPAKMKLAGKVGKLSSTAGLQAGKLQKQSPGSNGTGTTQSNTGSGASGITRRVKSPYNPSARSALGTRSRLKRLGK